MADEARASLASPGWVLAQAAALIAAQRGVLFPWCAVFFASGTGSYFAVSEEPGLSLYLGMTILALSAFLLIWLMSENVAPLLVALIMAIGGFITAGAHAWHVKAPVLEFRYYGPVDGRIVHIDRSVTHRMRLTLDQVVLSDMRPDRIPARIRISLNAEQVELRPGMHVGMVANVAPPQGPAEPGGFDFRRHAWFDQIGGVGYTRTPVVRLGPDQVTGFWLRIERMRNAMSAMVQSAMDGREGAFATAIMTGDRAAMTPETVEALRDSNLAHLLAISGLHMGLLVGFVFAALRYGLALIPILALNYPIKKIAAVVALLVATFYLLMSGGAVATMRAYVMVGVMLIAVLFDRRAISIHAVAIAALIVLLIEPQALTGPGFQMSFAATTALVFVFMMLRNRPHWFGPRWLRPVTTVVVSSLVAGLATAPFSAAHFNQVAQYGLLANVLAVPMMGLVVMPSAVIAVLLAPIGLSGVGFWLMKQGIRWILFVADWVAGLDGAVFHVMTPGPVILPLLSIGALIIVIWQGRLRLLGVPVMAAAALLWTQVERPFLLISESGRLIGLMGEEGRILNKARGDGFVARSWLENDGDQPDQALAAARAGLMREDGAVRLDLNGYHLIHFSGRGAAEQLPILCASADLVIYTGRVDVPAGCPIMDATALRESGSLALYADDLTGPAGRVPDWTSARERAGNRLWTQ